MYSGSHNGLSLAQLSPPATGAAGAQRPHTPTGGAGQHPLRTAAAHAFGSTSKQPAAACGAPATGRGMAARHVPAASQTTPQESQGSNATPAASPPSVKHAAALHTGFSAARPPRAASHRHAYDASHRRDPLDMCLRDITAAFSGLTTDGSDSGQLTTSDASGLSGGAAPSAPRQAPAGGQLAARAASNAAHAAAIMDRTSDSITRCGLGMSPGSDARASHHDPAGGGVSDMSICTASTGAARPPRRPPALSGSGSCSSAAGLSHTSSQSVLQPGGGSIATWSEQPVRRLASLFSGAASSLSRGSTSGASRGRSAARQAAAADAGASPAGAPPLRSASLLSPADPEVPGFGGGAAEWRAHAVSVTTGFPAAPAAPLAPPDAAAPAAAPAQDQRAAALYANPAFVPQPAHELAKQQALLSAFRKVRGVVAAAPAAPGGASGGVSFMPLHDHLGLVPHPGQHASAAAAAAAPPPQLQDFLRSSASSGAAPPLPFDAGRARQELPIGSLAPVEVLAQRLAAAVTGQPNASQHAASKREQLRHMRALDLQAQDQLYAASEHHRLATQRAQRRAYEQHVRADQRRRMDAYAQRLRAQQGGDPLAAPLLPLVQLHGVQLQAQADSAASGGGAARFRLSASAAAAGRIAARRAAASGGDAVLLASPANQEVTSHIGRHRPPPGQALVACDGSVDQHNGDGSSHRRSLSDGTTSSDGRSGAEEACASADASGLRRCSSDDTSGSRIVLSPDHCSWRQDMHLRCDHDDAVMKMLHGSRAMRKLEL